MLEGLCNPHMKNILSCPSIEGYYFEQNALVSSINGLRFCSSQTLSHLLNSSCFIWAKILRRLYTKTSGPVGLLRNVFLKTCANTTLRTLIIVHVVCMVNIAASYSTMLYPTILLSHPLSTPSHFSSHVLQQIHIHHCTTSFE